MGRRELRHQLSVQDRNASASLRRPGDALADRGRHRTERRARLARAPGTTGPRALVELLVSEDRKKGRVYGITDRGNQVWETIETENMT